MTLAPRTTSKRWELEGTLGTSGHERYVLPVELDFPINIITYFFSKEVRRKLLCLYFLDLKYFFSVIHLNGKERRKKKSSGSSSQISS